MNKKIKELAEQAELLWIPEDEPHLERFAELVRQNEREACAKLVEEVGRQTAAAIRARGDKHE